LLEANTNVEDAYQRNWKEFENGFWETEISVGRLRYPRSAIFLNHWLIARIGEEVLAREVFERFKRYADHDAGLPMSQLVQQLHSAAGLYRGFIAAASPHSGPVDRLGLFGYRTGILESEVVKPLVLYLRDPEESPIPEKQINKALDVVESWMVRRMLVRATTKNYNQIFAGIIAELRKVGRNSAGDVIEAYLARQTSGSSYWPDDRELQQELVALAAYRRLRRGRLRMVLEAIEDHLRGWKNGKSGLGDERVARAKFAIEHVMPRKWQNNWPIHEGHGETERDSIIHTFGNLTLLTGKLNSKVSNGPWLGTGGKREGLEGHDVLLLNRELLKRTGQWSDDAILERTRSIAQLVCEIWPVPPGHRSEVSPDRPRLKKVDLSDLIAGGALHPGMPLFPRRKQFSHRVATLLADGRVDVEGAIFAGPSDAATAIVGKRANGWTFFLTDQQSKLSLRGVRLDYLNRMAVDAEDDETDDDVEEDES
jgi:hypothetical protein